MRDIRFQHNSAVIAISHAASPIRNTQGEGQRKGTLALTFCTWFSEVKRHTRAEPEIVLMVVHTIVEGSYEIVRFYQTEREAPVDGKVDASADVRGKSTASVGGRSILSFDK